MQYSEQHYLDHLAQVSKISKVILAEDIYNHRGVLVSKKGAEVDRYVALKIAKHKLSKPLDNSISLTSSLNQRTSFEYFTRHLDAMQALDIVRQSGLYNDAMQMFHLLTRYPLITQKLTVLAERFPDVFGRCLSTSVMAIGLCKELKKSTETIENVFLANMISDVGLLHIDPEIVHKKGQYNQQEWHMMQGHVAIAKHFADMVPGLPKPVGRALLEHHERADGFGYPFGKQASQLADDGQIIAMVDKASALYRKLIKNGPHSWVAVISVIQLPSTAHNSTIQNAMLRLLKRFQLNYSPAFSENEFKAVVKKCIEKRERLNLWFKEFARIYVDHRDSLTDTADFKPLALLNQLEKTVVVSGVLSQAQHKWLIQLSKTLCEADFKDIEEFSLVLDEIEYQSFFVMRKLITEKDRLAKRFDGKELPDLYFKGLMKILDPDDKNDIG